MEVDFSGALSVAPRAFAAAATGVVLPVLGALGIVALFGGSIAQGLAAGAAIAPTSLGFSSQLLSDTGLLTLPLGRLIAAAAVLDDVMSLVLLSEVQVLSGSSQTAWQIAAPLVGSIGAIAVGSLLAWLVHLHGARLEILAEQIRDALPGSASSTPASSKKNTTGTNTQYTYSLPASRSGSLAPSGSMELPPAGSSRHNYSIGRASIAPSSQVQLPQQPPPVNGRADADSTMETVNIDGDSTAVSAIVTNASAASGLSVASRISTVQLQGHTAVPVTADNSVVYGHLGGARVPTASHTSNPHTSSVRLHTITLPSDTTQPGNTAHTHTLVTSGSFTNTKSGTAVANAVAAETPGSSDDLRNASSVSPMAARTSPAQAPAQTVRAGRNAARSMSDHFSTHDASMTVDSVQPGHLVPLVHARAGEGTLDSGENTDISAAGAASASKSSASAAAVQSESKRTSSRRRRAAPPQSELHAVSSGGPENDEIVTEEQVSTTSAGAPSVSAGARSQFKSRSEDAAAEQPEHASRPPPVRLREEVVTMNSEMSVVLPPSGSYGNGSSSEQSFRGGSSPAPPNTTSLPATPGGTLEFPAVPKRMSHSLAAMRLSTINSESNMLTRTADSDAMAAASQRALQLMTSLEEDQAVSIGRVLLVLLFALAIGLAAACSAVQSSDLMGVFLAGMALSGSTSVEAAWKQHVHCYVPWGSALFFACTVGFSVPPLASLFTTGAVLRGLCLLAVAVAGKLALGLWAYPFNSTNALLLGWAMNGRGEFSFLITQQAVENGLLGDDLAGGVVWAVVVSTILAPIGFRYIARKAGIHKRD